VDLLLIRNETKHHYCLINSLGRLLYSQDGVHTHHYCRRCLVGFREKNRLRLHLKYCKQHDPVRKVYLNPGSTMKFKNFYKSQRVPFAIYADFESFIKPIASCQPNPTKSYTSKHQMHVPSSYSYYIKRFDGSSEPRIHTAESEDDDVAQKFVDSLEDDVKKLYSQYFKNPKKMDILTADEQKSYNEAMICHICGCGGFSEDSNHEKSKVRDHCHFTGKFRGAAHRTCNLRY